MACPTVSRFWCAGAFAAGLLTLPPPAGAVEPRDIEILGLRLGMPATEVLARLQTQGAQDISPFPPDCREMEDTSCLSLLTARTKDGTLELGFGPMSTGISRIAYLLNGRGPNEQQVIRQAIRDRFGPPSVSAPPRWCSAAAAHRGCPDDSPHLELAEGPGTAMRLVLTSGGKGDARPTLSSALPAGQSQTKKPGQHHP